VETSKNKYDIEVALAGYNKKDIEVSFEDGQLLIRSKLSDKNEPKDADGNTIYNRYHVKGIAKRYFERSFTIADDVEVKGAELKDGLLKVSLEKIVPETKKPRTIDIK
jgi:molecular chaperone IbpA